MAIPILQTKLFIPPSRANLVRRAHLTRYLLQAVQSGQRLVLISAMAGTGKTTLLSEWIYERMKDEGGRMKNYLARESLHPSSPILHPFKFAWLSLEEEDNDPVRFWTYFAAALGTALEGLGQSLLQSLQSPQPSPIQYGLTQLLNEIAALPERVVLVLDDYHVISTRSIHEGLVYLLDHLPPQMLLVLATRADPPFPIGRLRARGQLTELRDADLRFSPQETATFLNDIMALDLRQEDVLALEARTEGWIVGLQLAALALQDERRRTKDEGQIFVVRPSSFVRDFTGSHQFILEYLLEEVLNRQTAEVQDFLVKTSILERMCAELCDAIRKDEGGRMKDETRGFILHPSAFILEHLERSNLFVIPLDNQRRWYRYHHLFADLLRNRLRQRAQPEEIARLHQRAGRWLEANGFLDDAVRHGMEAGDYTSVASIAERASQAGMLHGRIATLLKWFSALPDDLHRRRPGLRLYHAWAHFLNGRADLAERMLLDLRDVLLAEPDLPENRVLLGLLFTYLATIASMGEDTKKVIHLSREALAYLPEAELSGLARAKIALGAAYGLDGEIEPSSRAFEEAAELARKAGNSFLFAHVLEMLAGNLSHQARLREAAGIFQKVIEQAEGSAAGEGPLDKGPAGTGSGSALPRPEYSVAGIGYIGLAGITLEWNDLDLAAFQLKKGFEYCRQGGILYNLINAYLAEACLKKASGDRQGAIDAFRQAEQMYRSMSSLPSAVLMAWHQARLRLWDADLEQISHWSRPEEKVSIFDIPLESLPVSVREVQLVALARGYLARGEVDRVLELYDQVCSTALPGGRSARVVEISLLKALALQALGRLQPAAEALERSLSLAEPGGYLRIYLDEGEAVREILYQVAGLQVGRLEGGLAVYIRRILAEFEKQDTKVKISQPSNLQPSNLIDPLSSRELDVLRLIGQGYSNQEIAGRLSISLNTVKKHTSNLFGKLGVTSRTQAVAAGRQLGLIDG